MCIGDIGKGQTVANIVEVKVVDVTVPVGRDLLCRAVRKRHGDSGIGDGFTPEINRKMISVDIRDLKGYLVAEEHVCRGGIALRIFHIGLGNMVNLLGDPVAVVVRRIDPYSGEAAEKIRRQ